MNCHKYRLNPSDPDDAHYLDVHSGHLYVPSMVAEPMLKAYCVEMYENRCKGSEPVTFAFACFPPPRDATMTSTRQSTYPVLLFISCFFLALTLLVYLLLPPLRNLHGKTLMCQVASMLVAYLCLARVQIGSVQPGLACKTIGYVLHFSLLSMFTWLNVMCIDIWWTFGNMSSVHEMGRNKDWKKFLKYSAYGWGLPVALTLITFAFDHFNVLPGWLDPNIGYSQCWISYHFQKAPWLILFILPVGLIIGVNSALFVLTVRYCNRVKSEIRRMQSGGQGDRCKQKFVADRAKLAMNMKLFIVMGITWVTEIVSSLVTEPKIVWQISDFINVLLGIPVFCILVLKMKVYRLIKKRLGFEEVTRRAKSERTTSTTLTHSLVDAKKRSSIPIDPNTLVNGALIPKSP